jgi:soluble lytic murein transglycosylase
LKLPTSGGRYTDRRIPHFPARYGVKIRLAVAVLCLAASLWASAQEPLPVQREAFGRAWQAAAGGKRSEFESLMPTLQGYLLYPYLQYEDLRQRRAQVAEDEMSAFLADHADWAFSPGLTTSWLRSLADRGRWEALLEHAADERDTEVRCAYARAHIETGRTDELLPLAQELWTVGRSQPDACDPVFRWLQQAGGISPGLAWQRIQLSMKADQPRLALYLARFLTESDRPWAERWYRQHREGYQRLDRAAQWPDMAKSRDIVKFGLARLARSDPDRAWQLEQSMAGHFQLPRDARSGLLREIALWSAVNGSAETPERMRAVPEDARDDGLLEWATRWALASGEWSEVLGAIGSMSQAAASDSRWRYWKARALLETGQTGEAKAMLAELAMEASYHGFLAADLLGLPYTVCPESPTVAPAEIEGLAARPGFDRALELRTVGVANWSRSEWSLAVRGLDTQGLRAAAGLAVREGWPEMAIFALGDSGDQRWYEWRFPLDFSALVGSNASHLNLDDAWVLGLMRSESAMAVDALSSAGARGLMQMTPGTAKQVAKKHGLVYSGPDQLMRADDNVRFGTTYLRELLDRFSGNPVLVSGAYNAGPNAVDRWLRERPQDDPAVWVENLPYYETRDYIPRVLAFTTLYNWRLQRPVTRLTSRMPAFDSGAAGGTMKAAETTEVVCRATG